jgi:hypothetical protein
MEENGPVGINPDGQKSGNRVSSTRSEFFGVLRQRQCVPANNGKKEFVSRLGIVLQFDPIGQGTQVVTELYNERQCVVDAGI